MPKIGENVRRLRIARGLTQEELAKRVGYTSKSTINKIEQCVNDIPQSKIIKFADALDTTPSVLMGWVNEETNKKNDDIVVLVQRFRHDEKFLSVVKKLNELDDEKLLSVEHILSAFQQ